MQSVLLSKRDLEFLLFEWLRIDELTKRERFAEHSRETFDAVLDLCEQLATRYFANAQQEERRPRADVRRHHGHCDPRGQRGPRRGAPRPTWSAMAMDHRFGGAQLPTTVAQAAFAWFAAANISTSGYLMLTIANANLLADVRHPTSRSTPSSSRCWRAGSPAPWPSRRPQAGSSLADITTRAEPQPDGTYRLFGSKMWISGAEHEMSDNIVIWCSPRFPAARRAPRASRCSSCPKFLVNDDGSIGERNDVAIWPGSTTRWASAASPTRCSTSATAPSPPAAARRGRLSGRRTAPRHRLHVPHDERGPPRRRHGRGGAGLHRISQVAAVRPPNVRRAGRSTIQGPHRTAGPDHRARRREANVAGAEGLCRRRAGAAAVLRAAGRLAAQRRNPTRSATAPPCCSTS